MRPSPSYTRGVGDAAAPAAGRAAQVVGREAEKARLDAFAAALPAGPRALTIRGEPGAGKTALWRHAVERFAPELHVLLTRPAEEEMSLPLLGLLDLFEQVEPAFGKVPAGADPVACGREVLQTLRRLAATRPVVLAIDDVQWLDSFTARALRYALRRLESEPIGVLATARGGPEESDPLATASNLSAGACEVLDLGPLSLGALRLLLEGTVAAISRPTLRRIHEVSGGNPLYALELARALARDDRPRTATPRIALPESLQAAIAERLERVPPELAPLLETVSAVGRSTVTELRETLPSLDLDHLLAAAERHGLLVVEEDFEVRFSHPIVRSAVYGRLSPLARRSLHARLAGSTDDARVQARHLALSTDEPDARVARLLEDAADDAGRQGALDLAADLAGHSVRLTSRTDPDAIVRRSLSEVKMLAAAGEMGHALAVVERLVEQLPPGPRRAEALLGRAELEDRDLDRGESFLLRALEDAGDDARLRGRVLDLLGWHRGIFQGRLQAGIECAREAVAIADRLADAEMQMSAAAGLSNMEALAGRPRPDLIARAVELEQELGRPLLWAGPRVLQAEQLLWTGDLAAARALFEAAQAGVGPSGSERWRSYGLYNLASLECAAGNLARADELVHQAMAAARDSEDEHVESWIYHRLALVSAWLGRADEARAAARHHLDEATRRGERLGLLRARRVLGLLALSEGDAESAVSELTEAVRLLEQIGFANPGSVPALPDAVEALAGFGDEAAAGKLLERLDREAESLGNELASALAARARGHVLLAAGKAGAAEAPLEDAAASFDRLGYGPDAARALLVRGRALLRGGRRRAAAETLAAARGRFAAMGAVLWEARAAEELERAAPGRVSGELTAAEQRVAALAAQGLRNREIGQALFMSVATVEAHLTRIYRKLDLRSRSDLARLLADGNVHVAESAEG